MEAIKEIISSFPASFLQGLILNSVLIGLTYLIFWKLLKKRISKWRIQLKEKVDTAQIKRELWNALPTMAVGTTLSCIVIYFSTKGYTQLYTDFSAHSPWLPIVSFFVIFIIDDAWFYWVHRLLHHPKIYRYVHAVHHRSIDVNPFTSLSFHFLEPLLLTLWIIPVVFFIPVYAPILGLVQIWGLLDNIKSHLGYELYPTGFNKSPLRFFTASTFHNLHHSKFNGNYGVHFRFWDRLCGTEFEEYEETFDEVKTRKISSNLISH
jgi:Delta7-sterol 5-desaturase